jgi:DNA modification methylase
MSKAIEIYKTVGDATLYLGDCIEVMNSLPEKSVDMVFR